MDWEKKRKQLNKMFSDDALIYQVIDNGKAKGIELCSKDEFIDRLTMPSGTLSRIEIISTKYRDGMIIMMHFRIGGEQ